MVEHADERPVVLLTGFGPFPGVRQNASADLVREIAPAAREAFPGFRFIAAVLPTEWARAPQLIQILLERFRPLLALHFGVASGTRSIRIETQAANVCRASHDAVAMLPLSATLCVGGPERRPVTIDIAAISSALEAGGWPCTISNDAGSYLCNTVLYHSLAMAEALSGTKVGFIHIPQDVSAPPLLLPDLTAASLEIVRAALQNTGAEAKLTV